MKTKTTDRHVQEWSPEEISCLKRFVRGLQKKTIQNNEKWKTVQQLMSQVGSKRSASSYKSKHYYQTSKKIQLSTKVAKNDSQQIFIFELFEKGLSILEIKQKIQAVYKDNNWVRLSLQSIKLKIDRRLYNLGSFIQKVLKKNFPKLKHKHYRIFNQMRKSGSKAHILMKMIKYHSYYKKLKFNSKTANKGIAEKYHEMIMELQEFRDKIIYCLSVFSMPEQEPEQCQVKIQQNYQSEKQPDREFQLKSEKDTQILSPSRSIDFQNEQDVKLKEEESMKGQMYFEDEHNNSYQKQYQTLNFQGDVCCLNSIPIIEHYPYQVQDKEEYHHFFDLSGNKPNNFELKDQSKQMFRKSIANIFLEFHE